MGERTDRAMRESVLACAKEAHKYRKRYFAATNEPPGREPAARQEVENLIDGLNRDANQREREMWEGLYVTWGGDPADLPQDWDLR